MHLRSTRAACAALALGLGAAMIGGTTAPAAADDVGTDALIGAAVGGLVGTLLRDPYRNQYYYVDDYRRRYVDDRYVQRWRAYHRGPESRGAYWRGDGGWHRDGGWRRGGSWQHDGSGWRGDGPGWRDGR